MKKKTTAPKCKGKTLIPLMTSPVAFAEETHEYNLNGKNLSGITSLLSRQLFRDKYDGIPQRVLDEAARRGTIVHELCQFEDESGLPAEYENNAFAAAAHRYTQLREQAGFTPVETEYLVSDLEHVASRIDCVWRDNNSYILCDIKTTQKYDELYLRWQLSIYAYLFERQNLGADVSALYAAWLPLHGEDFNPDEAQLIPVARIPDEEVQRLLAADAAGEQYQAPEGLAPTSEVIVRDEWLPEIKPDAMEVYINAVQMLRESEQVKKDIEECLRESMSRHGIKSWDTGAFKVSYIAPSESTTFDAKAFAADHPDLYEQYLTKKTTRKDSVKVTIR